MLRKLRAVRVQQHNLTGWQHYVQELRDEHRRKRRLAELLDTLLRERTS